MRKSTTKLRRPFWWVVRKANGVTQEIGAFFTEAAARNYVQCNVSSPKDGWIIEVR